MTLRVEDIKLADFRNYEHFELAGIGALTVLVGPNAVGKTNVIEGIQLMTSLTSFRHPTIEQVIRHGASAARTEARITDGARLLDVSMTLQDHKRRYTLNGKSKRPSDLKGLMPSVAFTPDDLDLVKGPMSTRRAAIDALGSQLSPNHYLIKRDYEKVVRYKNRLLKEGTSAAFLDSINETLITCGAQLACYRSALFAKLAPEIARRYADISHGELLEACYKPSWSVDVSRETSTLSREEARSELSRALDVRRGEEIARKRSLVGPHADRVEFFLDGQDASLYGSQGQQRSIVLAFKLAEAAVIEDILDQRPILLLDDVMSELDAFRRRALVEFISGDVQTFITTANLAYFEQALLDQALVVELSKGREGEGR